MADRPTNAGVIVALIPDEPYTARRQTIEEHHLTVAYLGKYSDPDLNDSALTGFFESLVRLWDLKIRAKIAGQTYFSTPDGWAHVDLIDAPFLPDFRGIVGELLDVHGLPISRDHGLLPHITRRYIKSPSPMSLIHNKETLNFSFERVALWAGDLRLERPLK
jgi:hypothetical protein